MRKRVRERDHSKTDGLASKRSKADTETLLPPYLEDVKNSPQSEEDISRYDRERLQSGLKYISGETSHLVPQLF